MVTNQAYLFFIFIINGIIIGMLFDFFRILRKSFKTSDFITYIEDSLFWVLTGVVILYSIFIFNNGEIRFFMFLGIILGLIIYMFLFLVSCYFSLERKVTKSSRQNLLRFTLTSLGRLLTAPDNSDRGYGKPSFCIFNATRCVPTCSSLIPIF